ncbi:MAG: peroxide stress protein YaaA, partial [Flavobacteriia bacterium]
YLKLIYQKRLKNQVITPVFKEFKEGQYKIVMMYAKHARGAMARYIVKQNIQHPEELKLYDVDGYAFDEKLSSDKEWVFVR